MSDITTGRELVCDKCRRDYPIWYAPNKIWNAVTDDDQEFLCPLCFVLQAKMRGVGPKAWLITDGDVETRHNSEPAGTHADLRMSPDACDMCAPNEDEAEVRRQKRIDEHENLLKENERRFRAQVDDLTRIRGHERP